MTWKQIAFELNAATDELKADNDKAEARERCLAKIASLRNGTRKRNILRKLCALRARARYNPVRENYDPYWLLTLECGVWK